MSKALERNISNDLYQDLSGNFRTIFNVKSGLEKDEVYNFIRDFGIQHENEDAVWWMEENDSVSTITVTTGYSQLFENEFNATFN